MMDTSHSKRGRISQETDSFSDAAKRVCYSLDWLDDGEIADTTTLTESRDLDQVPEYVDGHTERTLQLESSFLERDSDISVLENPVPDFDLAAAREVCYGALCDVQAALLPSSGVIQGQVFVKQSGNFQQFEVVYHDNYHALLSPDSLVFARLDNATSAALRSLHVFSSCHITAVIESAILCRASLAGKSKGIFPLSLNIMGPEDKGDIIGERLANASAFLQHPGFLEDGYEYYNPQYFYPGNKKKYLTYLIGLSESDIRAKRLSDEVEEVLASLDNTSVLGSETVNDFVVDGIITPLKRHQKSALSFIRQHEDHDECQSMAGHLHRLIGFSTTEKVPSHSMGGILADVMGLGKTLSILSAITSSRLTSISYQKCTENVVQDSIISPAVTRSRATLVVVTSIQVLDGWKREIAVHLLDDILKYMVFHGDSRPKQPDKVIEHDLVLTTYATLVADWKGPKVLQKVAWFRVVLDEAHWIRNQSSQQFRVCERLLAQRRWCVTGTPIQNSLYDLLSLLRFLHMEPFCRSSTFQKYILDPLSNENSERVKMLHVLLRGICLRRNEKYLEMPEPCYKDIKLMLSTEEKILYDGVLKKFQEDLDNLISTQSKTKKYAVLFAMVMKLRRLCNHGTMITTNQLSAIAALDLDSAFFCDYCQGKQEDSLATLNKEKICPECDRIISVSPQSPANSALDVIQSSVTSSQVSVESVVDRTLLGNLQVQSAAKRISTKLAAVVENLKNEMEDSKSLVFSYWTSTLDLLQSLLEQNNIPSLRIDGRVSYEQRLRALETFQNDPRITVLLMSIQTGAVGLNLAIANRVHIIEPQWNPSVEEQAIARALRMGQTRIVTVIRYSMKSTVEENIQNMQRKKRNLAKFTLDGAAGDSATLDDLKFMLHLK